MRSGIPIFFIFARNSLQAISRSAQLKQLTEELFKRIVPHGFVQTVSIHEIMARSRVIRVGSLLDNPTGEIVTSSRIMGRWLRSYINKVIFAPRYITTQISKHRVVRKRSYKDFDPVMFIDKDKKTSWAEQSHTRHILQVSKEKTFRV